MLIPKTVVINVLVVALCIAGISTFSLWDAISPPEARSANRLEAYNALSTLQRDLPTASPTPTAPQYPTGIVDADQSVNIRSSSSTQSSVITAARPGTQVIILSISADEEWLFVELPDGTQGWIAAGLVDYSEDSDVLAATPALRSGTATRTPRASSTTTSECVINPEHVPPFVFRVRNDYGELELYTYHLATDPSIEADLMIGENATLVGTVEDESNLQDVSSMLVGRITVDYGYYPELDYTSALATFEYQGLYYSSWVGGNNLSHERLREVIALFVNALQDCS